MIIRRLQCVERNRIKILFYLLAIVLEVGLISPPVGFNVFVLKPAAPTMRMTAICWGILPFLLAAVLAVVLVTIFTQIALFMPSMM